jgi:hypothetical protein
MAYGDFVTQVGEEVGIVRRSGSYGSIVFSKFGTVTKINGHGHIFVQCDDQERRFDKTGKAYRDNYGPSLISAGRLSNELAREAERKERARLARELEAELKSGWSYSGTFHATAERIAAMKNLVAELEKVVDSTI